MQLYWQPTIEFNLWTNKQENTIFSHQWLKNDLMIASCRHGKEEDEVMGVSFKKELIIDRKQVSTILIGNLNYF